MSFISQNIAWPPWKFGVLKMSMVSVGILLGAYFPEFWLSWQVVLWGIFAVTAVATTVWGMQSMLGSRGNAASP